MAPTVEYMEGGVMQAYLAKIVPGAYQEVIDHVWLNILDQYFNKPKFGVEREAFVDDPTFSQVKANVLVTNVEGSLHKVLLVEAKRFPKDHHPGWETRYGHWHDTEVQFENYMINARETFGHVQTMYGIVAVGDRAGFYRFDLEDNDPGALKPYPDIVVPAVQDPNNPVDPEGPILSIHTDGARIEKLLKNISRDICREVRRR